MSFYKILILVSNIPVVKFSDVTLSVPEYPHLGRSAGQYEGEELVRILVRACFQPTYLLGINSLTK